MSNSNPNRKRSVVSPGNDDDEVPAEIIAKAIQNMSADISAHGTILADRIDRFDEGEQLAIDSGSVMADLLKTANELVEVATTLESARQHE